MSAVTIHERGQHNNEFSQMAKPLIYFGAVMNVLLTLVFVTVIVVILVVSRNEHPNKPIRVWVQVFLGLMLVTVLPSIIPTINHEGYARLVLWSILQLANVAWWAVGLYWLISGGETLVHAAPVLFWFTVVLIGMGAILGVSLCCAFSCICCCGAIAGGIFCCVRAAESDQMV